MNDEKIQEEIDKLLRKIQTWEDTDPMYLAPTLKELRHKVMHVHLRMEISMEIIIGDYLVSPYSKYNPHTEDGYIFRYNLRNVIDSMDFIKKLKVLEDAKKNRFRHRKKTLQSQ